MGGLEKWVQKELECNLESRGGSETDKTGADELVEECVGSADNIDTVDNIESEDNID